MNTRENAVGRWYGILTGLGLDKSYLTGKHGPCPLCQGRDRFRWDNKDGFGTYFCSGCGPGDGFALAMKFTGYSFKRCASRIDELCGAGIPKVAVHKKVVPLDRLRRIGEGLVRVTDGDPVALYLQGRGLGTPTKFLRLHPRLPYWDGKNFLGNSPAMVAAFRNRKGKVVTYHVTYLTKDGKKADVPSPKKVMSGLEKGGAIRLSDPAEVMGIAEGIETAIAARMLSGVKTWSAVNTTCLIAFEPPAECKKLIIYGDHDQSFAGQSAAYQLAHRLRDRLEVSVELPAKPGDWADEVVNAG